MEEAGEETARTVELFKALAHPVRLALVRSLATGDHAVHELVELLEVPQPRVSQQLGILRGARLVATVRHGREVRYRLTDDHVAHIVTDALVHAEEPH